MPPMENSTRGGTPLAIQKVFFQSMVRCSDLSPTASVITLMFQLPLVLNRSRRLMSPAASNENRPARGRGRWYFLPVFGDGAGRPDRRGRIVFSGKARAYGNPGNRRGSHEG